MAQLNRMCSNLSSCFGCLGIEENIPAAVNESNLTPVSNTALRAISSTSSPITPGRTLAQRVIQAPVVEPLRSISQIRESWIKSPKIDWIFTGGTLSMVVDEKGVRKNPDANWLLKNFPLKEGLDVKTVKLFGEGIDSSQVLLENMDTMIDAVGATIEKGRTPLITHGTDSLATSGLVLSQVFPNQFLVMTAAFLPIGVPNSDASDNLKTAFLVMEAAHDPEVPKVPYAVMNGEVYLASSLVKLDIEKDEIHRGFKSYQGPVGVLRNNKIVWDYDFINNFEDRRKPSVERVNGVIGRVLNQVKQHNFKLTNVEIGYVNPHTPVEYVNSMLNRLEIGDSRGLVLTGELGDKRELSNRIRDLSSRHFPIFIENTPLSLKDRVSLIIPENMQPGQVWSKIAVFGNNIQKGLLPAILRENIAGELAHTPIQEDFKNEFVGDNFYETDTISRGFLTYYQDRLLFKKTLVEEIARLKERQKSGKSTELVIEGLGNGHIYIGDDILNIIQEAKLKGIDIKITSAPRDAIPNGAYDVGQNLQKVGAVFANLPGRQYLHAVSENIA